jgi:mRNA interferase MazF
MAKRQQVILPKRGEIYLVNFDPTVGSEIQKTRPALILQNNISNQHSPITVVAALSSQFDAEIYPTEVLITPPEGGLSHPLVVLLNQIRSIDRQRLIKRLGVVSDQIMDCVNNAILISLGLIDL